MTKPWSYSHTQLSTWRQCQRLYHDTYILGKKEKKTPAMAAGSFLLHAPIETWLRTGSVLKHDWELCWANFLAELGETDTFEHPIYNLKTAKRALDLYKQGPIDGELRCVEERFYHEFPDGLRYVSIPDFIVERPHIVNAVYGDSEGHHESIPIDFGRRFTVDLKLTTAWKVNPLLRFDDQCLGQAICSGADGFIRVTFKVDKKTGRMDTPIIEEHMVDAILRDQWLEETWATCREIESWRQRTGASWPKNDAACYSWGRECHRLADCKQGA